MHNYADKALGSRFVTSNFPTVEEITAAADNEGIELSGVFANHLTDSENESFAVGAWDESLPRALKARIPVLWHHDRGLPIGFVKEARITPQGLVGSVVIPKPEVGTQAFEIYSALKSGAIPA